jgi:hypothetical protein
MILLSHRRHYLLSFIICGKNIVRGKWLFGMVTHFLNPNCSDTNLLFACKCWLNLLIIRVSDISGKVVASDTGLWFVSFVTGVYGPNYWIIESLRAVTCCYEELHVWLICLLSSNSQYLLILLEISLYLENFLNLGGFYFVYYFCFCY